MGMMIDKIIKKLLWFEDYNEDTYCGGDRIQDEYGDWYYKVNEDDFEAFRQAADTMRKYQKIEDIITCPLDIQEDVFRYKAICEVVGKKNITHGTYEGENRGGN